MTHIPQREILKRPLCICLPVLMLGYTLLLNAQPPQLPPPGQTLEPNRMEDLVAPIALYPDPLIGQILVACTYPLELVQAMQWLKRNPQITGSAAVEAASQQDWDPSVQALVVFPDLIQRLNQDIRWTTNLGNAFLSQEADVMDAIQRMRRKAEEAGRLSSTSQQIVNTVNDSGQPYIDIQPADASMMYLPDYDPGYIWGPALYYPYASWNYPRLLGGVSFGFGYGIPIGAYFGGGWGGWGGWGWRPGWGGHTVILNYNFLHRYNFNPNHGGPLNGQSPWIHDPTHRRGVPYANPGLYDRHVNGGSAVPPTRGGAPHVGWDRMGNREIPQNAPNGNRGAFGGVREGGAARIQSDHGYSSLGPGRSGGAAQRPQVAAPRMQQSPPGQNRGGGGAGAGPRGGAHK